MPQVEKISCLFCHDLRFNETASSHTWENCKFKGDYKEFIDNQYNLCSFCSDFTRYYNEYGVYVCIGNCINLKKVGYLVEKEKPQAHYDFFEPDPYKRKKEKAKSFLTYEPSRFKKGKRY